ncbi:hypothetical protein BH23ACT4_BH23ACT4_09820 [soil metagenome]
MASFLARMLQLSDSGSDRFIDDSGNVHEGDINRLASAGITAGCNPPSNDRYCPDEPVSRAQMASFLSRALNLAPTGTDHFGDDSTSIHEDAINRLADSGITKGCNPPANTSYCPANPVLRDQMASFLARALGLQPITPPPPATTTTLPGITETSNPTTTIMIAESDQLLMSLASDRSDPVPFGGAVTGNIYPFVNPAGTTRQVEFHLDDNSASGTPFQVESEAPFDMGGTVTQGEASPFRTTRLTNGPHTITVEIIRDGGPNSIDNYGITVSNSASLVFDPIALTFNLDSGQIRSAKVIAGTNNGSMTSFTVGPTGAEWLSVQPTSGSTGTQLTFTVDASGLSPGVYEAVVLTFSNGYRAGEMPVRMVVASQ